VTFQKDLGSYAAKTERVLAVAERLATRLVERACVLDGRRWSRRFGWRRPI
jgi:glycyl-tRNA synthetase beta subunit